MSTQEQAASDKTIAPQGEPPEKRHRVHIYASVRIEQSGIVAASHAEAIERAEANVLPGLHEYFQAERPLSLPGVGSVEFADEVTSYLVDEEGDEEYEKSRWYCADGKTPSLGLCPACRQPERAGAQEEGQYVLAHYLAEDPELHTLIEGYRALTPSEHAAFLTTLDQISFPHEVKLGETGENMTYKTREEYLADVEFTPISPEDYEAFKRLFGKAEEGDFITLKVNTTPAADEA